MTDHPIIIQKPSVPAKQLILLFHGWGSNATSMLPVGEHLATAFPDAMVVSVNAPTPTTDLAPSSTGYEWFSVKGVTEDNRQRRVDAAMPDFVACVKYWQKLSGVPIAATALIGFSQGAIMALEASKLSDPLFGRMLSIAGRFATLPTEAAEHVTLHLLHGKDDPVIPYSHTVNAAHQVRDLGGDVTAEVLPFIGHEIHPEFIERTLTKLSSHISHRVWEKAIAEQGQASA